MIHKTRGIVLHHRKYRESSAIVYLYTSLYGRQTYLVNNIRGKRSKFHQSLIQPLTLLELEVYHKEGRELQRLKEMSQYAAYRSIPFDLVKSSQAMFIAEILYKVLREEEANPGLYSFLESNLQWLDYCDTIPVNFHLHFLVQLTRFLGFYPENNYGPEKKAFDMRNGDFGEGSADHPDFFALRSAELLHALLGCDLEASSQLSVSQRDRFLFLEDIMHYYQLHIHEFGTVKSLKVLNEIYLE